ncbi:uncharacterized protein HD556DRAFT_221487 [Suillus plorans]|uniref:DUF6533 domain-containing protein n=1 Tax=Suillus plorans TaxID=116603 RepID=A0A9P7DM01_9AGAM|nr:uncharacterized protein HD556DRAFT_221487 [Suillus plorans]KAG1798124.1 hypothetical protein HD556DRAFT_221487 [Suillus plorans]
MTIVLNDPASWPTINANYFYSYFVVAAFVGATYDWALTLGQEVELIWRQRWSLMTVLYLCSRYLGILSAGMTLLVIVPTIPLTDTVSWIMYVVRNWTGIVIFAILWVIIITRLYAMYQGSRKILIFLVVTCLAVTIYNGVEAVLMTIHALEEEFILSGTYQCTITYTTDTLILNSVAWTLSLVWEVLALCLAAWIAVKHFRELPQHSAGGIMEDCFAVLMKTHVLYFASFVGVSCFQLIINLSPTISSFQNLTESLTFYGLIQILDVVQMFVLGPRLILGVREFNAKLVADSDAATVMSSVAFQERVHISTGSGV